MIDPTIATLCRQFLEGDEDTLGPLSDRLEDVGHNQNLSLHDRTATFNVNGKTFTLYLRDPYEVVYHALPDVACIHLACDFAEHVADLWEKQTDGDPLARRTIEVRRA